MDRHIENMENLADDLARDFHAVVTATGDAVPWHKLTPEQRGKMREIARNFISVVKNIQKPSQRQISSTRGIFTRNKLKVFIDRRRVYFSVDTLTQPLNRADAEWVMQLALELKSWAGAIMVEEEDDC